MSFIKVELKVIEVLAPEVARASGVPEERIGWGLVRLWHSSWSKKREVASRIGLAGVFGADGIDLVTAALVDAGFLDPVVDGWRVRGADTYLRITEARSKGGKAASGNLKRGAVAAEVQPGVSRESAGSQPVNTPGSSPGLPPSTEHRAPKEKNTTAPAEAVAVLSLPQLELVSQPTPIHRQPKPPDPVAEFARFTSALTDDEAGVFAAYESAMGLELGPDWGLKKLVGQKLKAHTAEELRAAIKGHALDPWRREKSPSLRAILRDASIIAAMAKLGRVA